MNAEIAFNVAHAPAYASLNLKLRPNQTVMVESGAMAAMDTCIKMKSKVQGGLMKGIGRMLGGESLFVSEFTAVGSPGELMISPGVPGDIQHYQLTGRNGLLVQGFKGFFSGESLFLIKVTGNGDFWFSSYGAILEIPVSGDFVVDTGYIVAFEDTLNYKVEMLGGLSWKGLRTGIFGGEGLVCRFQGEGKLWVQSRNLYPLINFLNPFRPTKS